jgi:4-alpha-glucanotransferase
MAQSCRSGGVLLHITSLPTRFGIGDLGPSAHRWIDLLAAHGQRWWQILPVHPPDAHNSPYQSLSAFAGNPLLISPELLSRDGWVAQEELPPSVAPSSIVDFRSVGLRRRRLLNLAHAKFRSGKSRTRAESFERFRHEQRAWLDDFALFSALRDANPAVPWQKWPRPLARRSPGALKTARAELADPIERHQFTQFLFFDQFRQLREHAKMRGVGLIGDLPIFVSLRSADVWASSHLFQLDRNLQPTATAGVPPDAFSASGQAWGNPLYDWRRMERDRFRWWVDRLRAAMRLTDVVRIDHFRGLEAYWSIPARSRSAREGRWIKAPGEHLLAAMKDQLGTLAVIAEDLGMITDEVHQLRDRFDLPGMRVLQFAFGSGPDNPHLPHNYPPNSVVYTATHDNDTTASWYAGLDPQARRQFREYAGNPATPADAVWSTIRLVWASVARRAIVPAQDLLASGNDARMNYPGRTKGNWRWKMRDLRECQKPLHQLEELTTLFGR